MGKGMIVHFGVSNLYEREVYFNLKQHYNTQHKETEKVRHGIRPRLHLPGLVTLDHLRRRREPEAVKKSPGSGGELKGEPLITVHGLQGVVDRGNACPSWVCRRRLPPP